MPAFSHRPTELPGADPATDRTVLLNGNPIGRVERIEDGPAAGNWTWSAFWVGDDNRGRVASLSEALDAIRTRATPDSLKKMPPRYAHLRTKD